MTETELRLDPRWHFFSEYQMPEDGEEIGVACKTEDSEDIIFVAATCVKELYIDYKEVADGVFYTSHKQSDTKAPSKYKYYKPIAWIHLPKDHADMVNFVIGQKWEVIV